jgi:uncharacterized protein YndB with AHSA1/START domain
VNVVRSIAIVIVVLLCGVIIFAATKPDTFRVERAMTIKAPPEKIFPLIDDLRQWSAWSPWEKKDPAMKRTHSGARSGKGAVYEWEGNSDVGAGRMQIIESTHPSKIRIKLDFTQPFEAHNTTEFRLEPKGDSTAVTWAMHGPAPFISKVMQVFVSMDSMIGKDFEAGLASLKAVAEK